MCLGKYISWLPTHKIVAIHILYDIQRYLHIQMKLRASLVVKTKEVLNHYLVLFHLGTCYFEKLQFLALQCSTDVMKSFDLLEV